MSSMTDTIIASKRLERTLEDGRFVIAEAKLYSLGGQTPYFSLTGEEWQTKGHYDRRTSRENGLMSAGAIHETLLEAFPELSVIEPLHLANENGVPMYAVGNGFYWYQEEPRKGAEYLRMSPPWIEKGMDKEAFTALVDRLRPQWKEEAARAIAWLKS